LATAQGTYDENALRLEGHGSDVRIVRGVEGVVLARVGGFRTPDVVKLVSPSQKAIYEAKIFGRNYGPGSWLTGLGIATLGAAIGVSRIEGINRGIPTGLFIGAAGTLFFGASKLENAYTALSRSIWWYNRDLTR
jgi:hypothetical protein